MTADAPLVYPDACIFLEVLQQTHGKWRDSLKVLEAGQREDVRFLASRLLAVEVGRFRRDATKAKVDQLVLQYLDSVRTQWAEVDLLVAQQARALSWQYEIKSGADAIRLATAVRYRVDYFMSRDGGFPYGQKINSTLVVNPSAVWAPTLIDAAIDNESEPNFTDDSSGSQPESSSA